MNTLTLVSLAPITCAHAKCGMVFGVPPLWQESQYETHATFYCPNGHTQSYRDETEEEKLRKQLAAAQGNLNYYQSGYRRLSSEVQTLERSRAAVKGQVTKLRKRVANGVCAVCHRTFKQVAAHMKNKHPGFETETADA